MSVWGCVRISDGVVWSQSESGPFRRWSLVRGSGQNRAGKTNGHELFILYSVEVQPQLPVLDDRRFSNRLVAPPARDGYRAWVQNGGTR